MPFLKKVFAEGASLFRTSHASRDTTAKGLRASAVAAETSGTAETRQAWTPATRNAVELVEKFDEILTALGTSENAFPLDQTIYARLLKLQAMLPQYKLSEPAQVWEGDARTKRLIFLSAYASKAAYGTESANDAAFTAQSSLVTVSGKSFEPNFDGSIKQMAVRLLAPQAAPGENQQVEVQTLYVAIRGTVSFADWMVNFNGNAVEAPFLSDASQQGNGMPKAHTGLLRVAVKMEPALTKLITEHLAADARTTTGDDGQPKPCHIVLTGHSAGGGVAALLFLHYLRNNVFPNANVSCVTFAAPPVVSNDDHFKALPETSDFISIINEGDPVPRADKPYIFSFADFYGCVEERGNTPLKWTLPSAELHIPKESTILALRILEEDENGLQVELDRVGLDEVENTVALDFERHGMKWYIEELEAWAGGT